MADGGEGPSLSERVWIAAFCLLAFWILWGLATMDSVEAMTQTRWETYIEEVGGE